MDSSTGSGPGGTTPRRMGDIAALISALAAVVGLVVGFLGLPAVWRPPTAKVEPGPTVTATVTVTPAGNPDTDSGQAEPPPSSGSPASETVGAARTATFDMVRDYGFRVTDDPVRPFEESPGWTPDFYWDSSQDRFRPGDGLKLTNDGSSSYARCRDSTRFVHDVDADRLTIGQILCLTGPEIVALIEVAEQDEGPTYVNLKVTVWQRP
ncbi:hypothetical protein AB0D49_25815 [Streptomyces sp. NPDC048290]|uniref:hypothetical protein n=1 Tax=Streptomyces sp. NPDC048290 TaxID=3155811 RepID=UPI00343837A9